MTHDHKDGSGSVAIKMVQTDTKLTIASDVLRLIFSIGLLTFSVVSVIYAISISGTTMPFPPFAQFICLGISLFILGVLEGLQIAVVELAHKDPSHYKEIYPRAAKLLAFENKGRNVERFLMGRQVLVVFTVFVAARITTFDQFWADAPQEFIHSLMFSGFLGVILVVIVAQLTPQVLAAAYPAEFLNLPGMPIAFWACLMVEASGIAHAVWFLCVVVRRMFYDCLCGKHEKQKEQLGKLRCNVISFEKVASLSPLSDTGSPISPSGNDTDIDLVVTNNMVKTAEKIESNIEANIDTKIELVSMHSNKNEIGRYYNDEFHVENESDIDDELQTLISDVGNKRDLFYIYGNQKFFSPSRCYDKFKNAGLTPPNFLLPPDHIDHIPPHIIAMSLLKMYTEKITKDE